MFIRVLVVSSGFCFVVALFCFIKALKQRRRQINRNLSVEDQLKIARKNKRPRLKLECVRKNKCPDCKTRGQILAGPCGGMAQNVKCGACGSEFNITPFGVQRL